MKAVKVLNALSGVALVAGLGVAWWAWHFRQSVRAETREWQARAAADQLAQNRAETALAAARQAATALQSARPAKARVDPMAVIFGHAIDGSTILAKHPELQRAFEKAYAADREQAYGVLYRRLQLTRDQIDRLGWLMAKDMENSIDIMSVAQAKSLPPTDPAIVKLRQEGQADLAAQESTVLGAADFQAFQTFNVEMPVRSSVKIANSMAVATESGMTSDTEEQVTQSVTQTDPDHVSNPTQALDPAKVNWDTGFAQAAGTLNANQVAALRAEASLQSLVGLVNQYWQKKSSAKAPD